MPLSPDRVVPLSATPLAPNPPVGGVTVVGDWGEPAVQWSIGPIDADAIDSGA
jgi:hypothetical protein